MRRAGRGERTTAVCVVRDQAQGDVVHCDTVCRRTGHGDECAPVVDVQVFGRRAACSRLGIGRIAVVAIRVRVRGGPAFVCMDLSLPDTRQHQPKQGHAEEQAHPCQPGCLFTYLEKTQDHVRRLIHGAN